MWDGIAWFTRATHVKPWDLWLTVIWTERKIYTPVAAHRLSMMCERHDISQQFLANLTMRNNTRVLSFTVTRANIEILKVLELRNLLSAYINMIIPVILRPNSSVYDLQKLRYRCAGRTLKGRGKISMFARVTVNDSNLVLFLRVKLARNRWEQLCCS